MRNGDTAVAGRGCAASSKSGTSVLAPMAARPAMNSRRCMQNPLLSTFYFRLSTFDFLLSTYFLNFSTFPLFHFTPDPVRRERRLAQAHADGVEDGVADRRRRCRRRRLAPA